MKTIALSKIHESKLWNFKEIPISKIKPMPLTKERASSMLKWLKAYNDYMEADDELAKIAIPMSKEILNTKGRDATRNFCKTLPPSITKAYVNDIAEYGVPSEDEMEEQQKSISRNKF